MLAAVGDTPLTPLQWRVWFLSAMGIFSLMSVSVSRRTREIGLRAALGANPRRVLGGILGRAVLPLLHWLNSREPMGDLRARA